MSIDCDNAGQIKTYDLASNTMRPVTQDEYDTLLCWHQALGCVRMDYESDPELNSEVRNFIKDVVSTFIKFRRYGNG